MVITLIVPIVMITVTGASLLEGDKKFDPSNYIYQAMCLTPNVGFVYGITMICESEELGEPTDYFRKTARNDDATITQS